MTEPMGLGEYFSDKDRIKELEKQLIRANQRTAVFKKKYEKRAGKKALTRRDKAIALINKLKGTDLRFKLVQVIAKKCFLSESTISQIWDLTLEHKTIVGKG